MKWLKGAGVSIALLAMALFGLRGCGLLQRGTYTIAVRTSGAEAASSADSNIVATAAFKACTRGPSSVVVVELDAEGGIHHWTFDCKTGKVIARTSN
jgi:hypothetical protein